MVVYDPYLLITIFLDHVYNLFLDQHKISGGSLDILLENCLVSTFRPPLSIFDHEPNWESRFF